MEFEDQMIQYEMIDLESRGFVTFSKKRLLAIFGGQRFAKESRKRLLSYLPENWNEDDVLVMECEDNILLATSEKTKPGDRWI